MNVAWLSSTDGSVTASEPAPCVAYAKAGSINISVTLDLDFESTLLAQGLREADFLSAYSERKYGASTGLSRILKVLRKYDLRCTCFVPGSIAHRYSDILRELVEEGHEIAAHGYHHSAPASLLPGEQAWEVMRAKEAIEDVIGMNVLGYRSPSWDIAAPTLEALAKCEFTYDSSCMGGDEPYVLAVGNGQRVIEFPIHWTLDDWPYYSWRDGSSGLLSTASHVAEVWLDELTVAASEAPSFVTYTLHPSVSGRRSRITALESLLAAAHDLEGVTFYRHGDLASIDV